MDGSPEKKADDGQALRADGRTDAIVAEHLTHPGQPHSRWRSRPLR